MDNQNEVLAKKVVETFKKNVSVEARKHISENDFYVLTLIVQEALSLEMNEAVEMVDELEKRLKAMERDPGIDL